MCSEACVEKMKNLCIDTIQILFEDLINKLEINVLDSSKNSFENVLNNLSIEIKKKVLKNFLIEKLDFKHNIPEIIKNQLEIKEKNELNEKQLVKNELTLNENIKKLDYTNNLDKINQKAFTNSQTCNLMKHLLNFLNENFLEKNEKKKRKRKRKRKKSKQNETNHKIENASHYLKETSNETKKNEVNNSLKYKNEIKAINIFEEQNSDCQMQPNVKKIHTTLSNQNESNFKNFSKCLTKKNFVDEKKMNKDNLKTDSKTQKHNKKSLNETINQKSFNTPNNTSFEFSNEQNLEKIRKNDFLNNSKRVKRERSPSFKDRRRITSARKPPTIYKRFKTSNSSSTSSLYSTSSCSSSCTNCSNKSYSNLSSNKTLTSSSQNKKDKKNDNFKVKKNKTKNLKKDFFY